MCFEFNLFYDGKDITKFLVEQGVFVFFQLKVSSKRFLPLPFQCRGKNKKERLCLNISTHNTTSFRKQR